MAVLAAFVAAVYVGGLLAGSFVFTVLYLRLTGTLSLARSLVFAGLLIVFIRFASSTLDIGLYSGRFL
jgi:hypothetical protein